MRSCAPKASSARRAIPAFAGMTELSGKRSFEPMGYRPEFRRTIWPLGRAFMQIREISGVRPLDRASDAHRLLHQLFYIAILYHLSTFPELR